MQKNVSRPDQNKPWQITNNYIKVDRKIHVKFKVGDRHKTDSKFINNTFDSYFFNIERKLR